MTQEVTVIISYGALVSRHWLQVYWEPTSQGVFADPGPREGKISAFTPEEYLLSSASDWEWALSVSMPSPFQRNVLAFNYPFELFRDKVV